jgi:hypothetical protein
MPVASWRTAMFGASAYNSDIAGDSADPDDDGVPNLVEYAAGTDPLAADAVPWSYAMEDGFLTVTVRKNPALTTTNLTWRAESSADLAVWNADGTTILQDSANFFQARDTSSAATNSQHFLHVKVSVP